MSGGHYDYKYSPVQEMAEQIKDEAENWKEGGKIPCPDCNGTRLVNNRTCTRCLGTPFGQPGTIEVEGSTFPKEQVPDRKAISKILSRVSEAMRQLEWYDSGDSSDWEAVKKAFEKVLELNQP
jgi:excinuclease UvrABC ATPase subunit